MALSFVGATKHEPSGSVSTLTCTIHASAQVGDLLIFSGSYNNNSIASTPAGWNVWHTDSTTALGSVAFWRYVTGSDTPGTTTVSMTITTSRASAELLVYRGADATTPEDVASASTAGNGTQTFPAITPATAGAWVLAIGSHITESGRVSTTWSSSNGMTVDNSVCGTTAGATNATEAAAHFAWTAGAFTPNLTSNGTTGRSISMSSAIRPLTSSPGTVTAVAGAATAASTAPAIKAKSTVAETAGASTAATTAPVVKGKGKVVAVAAAAGAAAPTPTVAAGAVVAPPAAAAVAAGTAPAVKTKARISAPAGAAIAAATAPVVTGHTASISALVSAPAAAATAAATGPAVSARANLTTLAGTAVAVAPAPSVSGRALVLAGAGDSTASATAPTLRTRRVPNLRAVRATVRGPAPRTRQSGNPSGASGSGNSTGGSIRTNPANAKEHE